MGCRTNCKIFEEFSTAIEWIAQTKPDIAHAYVVHVWDVFFYWEFLAVNLKQIQKVLDVCAAIWIQSAADKTVLLAQIFEFVGITVDFMQKETRPPTEKVEKCRNL